MRNCGEANTRHSGAHDFTTHRSERRGHDATALLESLSRLRAIVDTVTEDAISPLKQAALARIGSRDPMDWPVVAAALALDCPIWTEDRDFFGAGVATWTTAHIEIYLRGN